MVRRKFGLGSTKRSQRRKNRQRRQIAAGVERLERRDLMALTFNFTYDTNGTIGFNHPTLGTARKAALNQAATEFGSWFPSYTKTIDVFVTNENQGVLQAHASGAFMETGPDTGFDQRVPMRKILGPAGAADPNGPAPDGELSVTWEDNNPSARFVWELGDDVQSPTEADFKSAIIHELTHILGFESGIKPNGGDTYEDPTPAGEPGLWDVFDQFVADGQGRLIDSSFRLNKARWDVASIGELPTTGGLFFDGPNAKAANGGQPVMLHSRNPFVEGSSVSHLRLNATQTDATHLMLFELRDGQVVRRLHPVEVAIMKDLGYDMTLPAPSIVALGPTSSVSEGNGGFIQVQLSARPPTNVVVDVSTSSSDLTVNSRLTFTPVNWNEKQNVSFNTFNNSDRDGDRSAVVNVSVNNALSDPLYHGISKTAGVSISDDEPDPLNVPGVLFGTGVGSPTLVYEPNGGPSKAFDPFGSFFATFTVGVSVAYGDVSNDGVADYVTGLGPGSLPLVKVFSSGNRLFQKDFTAFDSTFTGGVNVATGDFNADGIQEVITAQASLDGEVRFYSLRNGNFVESLPLHEPFGSSHTGGVTIATADVDGDGNLDLITGMADGGAGVRVFKGPELVTVLLDTTAFPDYTGGVNVAGGDFDGDGKAEIVVAKAKVSPEVKIIPGSNLSGGTTATISKENSHLGQSFGSGSRVAVGRLRDPRQQVLVVNGDLGNYSVYNVFSSTADFITAGTSIRAAGSISEESTSLTSFLGRSTVAVDNTRLATSVNLESSLNPQVVGQAATITATISETNPLTPRGFVTFTVDGVAQAPLAVGTNGKATVTVSKSTVGEVKVTAKYTGDANFAGSSSAEFVQTVSATSTTSTLTPSVSPAVFGQAITFAATISSTSGTPTGNVQFYLDGLPVATESLNAGRATLTLSSLSVGSHNVQVVYLGNSLFQTSTSNLTTVSVTKGNSSVNLSADSTLVDFGQEVAFTVGVTSVAPASVQPTGNVEIKRGDQVLAEQPIVNGASTFRLKLPVGRFQLKVSYAGDAQLNAAESNLLTIEVLKATPKIELSGSAEFVNVGQKATFTATIDSGGRPLSETGQVVFKEGETTLASVALTDGKAIFETTTLTAGVHNITAEYQGDSNYFEVAAEKRIEVAIRDLELILLDPTTTVTAGGNVVYALRVTNYGATPVAIGRLSTNLPEGLILDKVNSSPDLTDIEDNDTMPPKFGFNIGTLAPRTSTVRTITGRVPADTLSGKTYAANFVLATSDETNVANNSVVVTTTVDRQADLAVRVQAGPNPVLAGGKVAYSIVVENRGPSLANNVRLEHVLPEGMTLDTSSSDPGFTVTGKTVKYSLPTLATGQAQTFLISASVAAAAPAGNLSSTTTVALIETDPITGNNSVTTSTRVLRPTTTPNVVANGDSFAGDLDTVQRIPVAKLLANDLNPVNLTDITQPANGSLSFDPANQDLVYTPNVGFEGRDEFSYSIEGSISDLVVLAITDSTLGTSQMPLQSARFEFNAASTVSGSVTFQTATNEASPALLSALTRKAVLPTVTLLTRRLVRSEPEVVTQEVLRWTLFNVQLEGLGYQSVTNGTPKEGYSATFDRFELDVVANPDVVGSRYQTGFDLKAQVPFDSNQFGELATKYPLSGGPFSSQLGKETLMRVGDRNGLFVNDFSGFVSNSATMTTEGVTNLSEVLVQLPATRGSEQVIAEFLDKAVRKESLGDVILSRGFGLSSAADVPATEWTLKNAKVQSVSANIGIDRNETEGAVGYNLVLSYDEISVKQNELNTDQRTLKQARTATVTQEGTVTGELGFGNQRLNGGTIDQTGNHVLVTPSGDVALTSFSVSAVKSNDKLFPIQQISLTKRVDLSSPGMFAAAASGDVIPDMTYFGRKQVGSIAATLKWTLKDVIVTSYSVGRDTNDVLMESITLMAQRATAEVDIPNVSDGPPVTFDASSSRVDIGRVSFSSQRSSPAEGFYLEIGNAVIPLVSADWNAPAADAPVGGGLEIKAQMNEFSSRLLATLGRGDKLDTVFLSRYGVRFNELGLQERMTLKGVSVKSLLQVAGEEGTTTETYGLSFDEVALAGDTSQMSVGTATEAGFNFVGDILTDKTKGLSLPSDHRPEGLSLHLHTSNSTSLGGEELSRVDFVINDLSAGGKPTMEIAMNSTDAAVEFLAAFYGKQVLPKVSIAKTVSGLVRSEFILTDAQVGSYSLRMSDGNPEVSLSLTFDELEVIENPDDRLGISEPTITASVDVISKTTKGAGEFRTSVLSRDGKISGGRVLDLNGKLFEASSVTTDILRANSITSSGFRFNLNPGSSLPGFIASAAAGFSMNDVALIEYSNGRDPTETTRWELDSVKFSALSVSLVGEESPTIQLTLQPTNTIEQTIRLPVRNGTALQPVFFFDFAKQKEGRSIPFIDLERIPTSRGRVSLSVSDGYVDNDSDLVDDAVERSAPNSGDGNKDGKADDQQRNVASQPHPVTGNFVTLAAPEGQNLNNVTIITPGSTPPRDIDFRVGLLQYELTNAPVDAATKITIFIEGTSGFNSYYKFGPTKENPTPHYYRFLFDGRTGAEILSDRIVVHLRDGERGDDDLTVNGRIVDPGAPAINSSSRLFHNPNLPEDVNDNGVVEPIDALLVINDLNASGARTLPTSLALPLQAYSMLDVDGDNQLQPLDALLVINLLNRGTGQGEPSSLDADLEVDLSLNQFPASPLVGFSSNSKEESGEIDLTSVVALSQESLAVGESPPVNALGSSQPPLSVLPADSQSDNEDESFETLAARDDYFSQFQSL